MNDLERAAALAVDQIEKLEAGWSGYAEKAQDVTRKLGLLTDSIGKLAGVLPDPRGSGPIQDLRHSKKALADEVRRLQTVIESREKELNKLERDRETLWTERSAEFQARVEKWEATSGSRELAAAQGVTKVKIDVGGKVFSVSMDTLLREKGSFFDAMVSSAWASSPGDDGTYFLDRDPFAYAVIFNYLRDGDDALERLHQRPLLAKAVRKEADFLGMDKLLSKIPTEIGKFPNASTASCPKHGHSSSYKAHWKEDQGAYVCSTCHSAFTFISKSFGIYNHPLPGN